MFKNIKYAHAECIFTLVSESGPWTGASQSKTTNCNHMQLSLVLWQGFQNRWMIVSIRTLDNIYGKLKV